MAQYTSKKDLRQRLIGLRSTIGVLRMSNEVHKTGNMTPMNKFCVKQNNAIIFKHLQEIDIIKDKLIAMGESYE